MYIRWFKGFRWVTHAFYSKTFSGLTCFNCHMNTVINALYVVTFWLNSDLNLISIAEPVNNMVAQL